MEPIKTSDRQYNIKKIKEEEEEKEPNQRYLFSLISNCNTNLWQSKLYGTGTITDAQVKETDQRMQKEIDIHMIN